MGVFLVYTLAVVATATCLLASHFSHLVDKQGVINAKLDELCTDIKSGRSVEDRLAAALDMFISLERTAAADGGVTL
eukprot:scaffold22.g6099.t1